MSPRRCETGGKSATTRRCEAGGEKRDHVAKLHTQDPVSFTLPGLFTAGASVRPPGRARC